MNSDESTDDPGLEKILQDLGMVLRRGKSGSVLLVDARESQDKARINDAVICQLAAFERLKEIYLVGCQVTDVSVSVLAELERLEVLDLDGTLVTDFSLPRLVGAGKLKLLSLNQTNVSKESVAEIRKKMIGCRIIFRG